MGGAGAAEHGINVFGGIGQQGPVSVNDNTIAVKNITGGKRKGGSMIVDVGAPLVLTGLNQYMKRRSANKSSKKVGGKCSLKGGKKIKFGGKPKSRKIMKNKKGGKRRSMKKKSRKMRGGESTCPEGCKPVDKIEDDGEDGEDHEDGEDGEDGEDSSNGGGDENLNVTLAPGAVSGGGDEYPEVTLTPATI
jgi:hypothetical protein